jgi:hypothetical protein
MIQVYAGIHGLKSAVGWIAFLVSAYNVVAHVQGDYLLVMKHVFDNYDASTPILVRLLVRALVFLALT